MAKAAATQTQQTNPDNEVLDDKGVFSGNNPDQGDDKGKTSDKKDDPPSRVKVKIGDAELETDPGSAAALNALMQMNAQLQAQMNGFRTLTPEPKKAATEEYDYETGLFTEPKVALARLRQEIKNEIKTEMTGQYQAAETKKEFWSSFYTENADLKDNKLIVDAIVTRDWAKLSNLTPENAAKEISKAAKKEIMRLTGGRSNADPDADQNVIEGGSTKNTPPSKQNPAKDAPQSLSDVIRNRQAARRKAQFSKE